MYGVVSLSGLDNCLFFELFFWLGSFCIVFEERFILIMFFKYRELFVVVYGGYIDFGNEGVDEES